MSSLEGLDILVTRPKDAAQPISNELEQLGACCYGVPVLEIQALEQATQQQAIKSKMLDFDRYQIAIFISQNAARHGLLWIDRYWPQAPLGQRYFAIGAATAKVLNESFLGEVESASNAMNSEALLALPGLQQISGERVLIFRGQGGRQTLAKGLLERGAEVDYCELYRRQMPPGLTQQLQASDFNLSTGLRLLTVHSGESLNNLEQAINNSLLEAWRDIPLLVPGERVAGLARQLGYTQVLVAENASDSCMVATIQHWYSAMVQ